MVVYLALQALLCPFWAVLTKNCMTTRMKLHCDGCVTQKTQPWNWWIYMDVTKEQLLEDQYNNIAQCPLLITRQELSVHLIDLTMTRVARFVPRMGNMYLWSWRHSIMRCWQLASICWLVFLIDIITMCQVTILWLGLLVYNVILFTYFFWAFRILCSPSDEKNSSSSIEWVDVNIM